MFAAVPSGAESSTHVHATDRAGRQRHILALLQQLVPSEGVSASCLDGVTFIRSGTALARLPVCVPSIVIVYRQRKDNHLPDECVHALPHYMALPVPLPFETPLAASADEPVFAILVSIRLELAAELVLASQGCHAFSASSPQTVCPTRIDDDIDDAVRRLLVALTRPNDALILGPGIVREVLYRVLTGPQGWTIHAALRQHGHASRIGRALRHIHARYDQPVDVSTLASEAGMSVTAFHSHFKAVTSTTPMQYLKVTRLHKARLLMVQDGVSAATAARRVGYESSSQFSREFKRLFGRTPAHEAAAMKGALIDVPSAHLQADTYLTLPSTPGRRE